MENDQMVGQMRSYDEIISGIKEILLFMYSDKQHTALKIISFYLEE